MQFIFIAVVVLMIFFALKGWVEDHLPLVIAVGLFLVSWYFLGLLRTVILTVAYTYIYCPVACCRQLEARTQQKEIETISGNKLSVYGIHGRRKMEK